MAVSWVHRVANGYNLFGLLHRVMKRDRHQTVGALVDELGQLSRDDQISLAQLADVFNVDVPERYRIVAR